MAKGPQYSDAELRTVFAANFPTTKPIDAYTRDYVNRIARGMLKAEREGRAYDRQSLRGKISTPEGKGRKPPPRHVGREREFKEPAVKRAPAGRDIAQPPGDAWDAALRAMLRADPGGTVRISFRYRRLDADSAEEAKWKYGAIGNKGGYKTSYILDRYQELGSMAAVLAELIEAVYGVDIEIDYASVTLVSL